MRVRSRLQALEAHVRRMMRRRFLTILLFAPLALAAASGANAQVVICPTDCTIVGNETITGPVIVNGGGTPSPVITIDSRLAPEGPISITEGVQTLGPSSTLINAGPGAPVTITNGGSALNVLQGASASADANGGTLTLTTSGHGFGVVVQSFGPAIAPSTLTLNGECHHRRSVAGVCGFVGQPRHVGDNDGR
jgi:hypothetical protein